MYTFGCAMSSGHSPLRSTFRRPCIRAFISMSARSMHDVRRTWLILPVVICLFQGLSHANVRVPVVYYRGVCVRLIIRLIVYPTKDVFLTFQRDNCANRTANTTGEDSATIKPVRGETYPCWGLGSCWPRQRPSPLKRQV